MRLIPRRPLLFLHLLIRWLLAPLLLRLLSWPRLQRVYTSPPRYPRDEPTLRRIQGYVGTLARYCSLGKGQLCLRRCLVLSYFLNRWGESVVLHVGIQKPEAGPLQGHSWLTSRDGWPYAVDPQAGRFEEIAAFPTPINAKEEPCHL